MKNIFKLTLTKLKIVLGLSLIPSVYGIYNLINNIVTVGTSFKDITDVCLTLATMFLLSVQVTIIWQWNFYKEKIELLNSLDSSKK